jgi:lipopolysaccharide cholinephosphotransferase
MTPNLVDNQHLTERFNPEGSKLRENQKELLEILLVLADICRKNNIRWWLSSGTLLGAARHKGFIPWDDDIDIVMFKRDYRRLSRVLRKMDDPRFVFQTMQSDIEYTNVFGKFRKQDGRVIPVTNRRWQNYKWGGPFIDVFAIERNNFVATKLARFIYANTEHLTIYIKNRRLRRCAIRLIEVLCLGIINPILKVVGLINPKGEYHYTLGTGWAKHKFFKRDILPLTTISFEGHEFPAPKNTDAYLTNVYGNWRELPSDEQIKRSLHSMEYIEEFFGK